MKKVIHVVEATKLRCDNTACGMVVQAPKPMEQCVGMPCPQCGENLLTERDFKTYQKTMRVIAWINRWFGWLGAERPDGGKRRSVHHHHGTWTIKEK